MDEPSKQSQVILLVESNRSLASLVASILGRDGYSVLIGNTFEEALTLLGETADIHLLITDVDLGGASGIDLDHRVSNVHPEAKVLYLSSISEPDLRALGISQDAKVLMKPLALSDLVTKVQELLRRSQDH